MRPLDLEELDRLLTCAAFSLVENADRMLFIGEVLLQLEHFMIHCSDWVLEAATELGHVEHIVNLRKVWRKFQLICHFSTPFENSEGTDIARS